MDRVGISRFLASPGILEVLSAISVNVPLRLLGRYADVLQELKVGVEIGIEGSQLDVFSTTDTERLREFLPAADTRITLHGPFWDLAPGSVDSLIREASRLRLSAFFDIVSSFRPIQVVCHTGFDARHHNGQLSEWVQRSIEFWKPFAERAEKLNTMLMLENVWESGPEFHYSVLQGIGSPHVGFCLDVGHQNCFSTTALPVWLESLGPFLGEVHLHDNDGDADSHLPIGHGKIKFEELFAYLDANKLDPVLTLEPHTEEHLFESVSGLAAFWK